MVSLLILWYEAMLLMEANLERSRLAIWLSSRSRCIRAPSGTSGSWSGTLESPAFLQSTVTSPGALVHPQGRGHPVVSGQESEETGKSLRSTLEEEEEGELKKEEAEEDRGVSTKSESCSCWQVTEVGTT